MAQSNLVVILILSNILFLCASSSAFEELVVKTVVCEEKCTNSFPPHTYPNGSDDKACARGCRFYDIGKIVSRYEHENANSITKDGITPTKELCYSFCIESYNETSSDTAACKVGCDNQELATAEKKTDAPEDEGMHLLKPIMQVREVASKIIGMLRIIQSSITTYFVGDNDELVAVEGPVEVVVQVLPPDLEDGQEEEHQQQNQRKIEPSQSSLKNENIISRGATTLECLSREVGVPPYLLVISLLSFIIFLSYILFIICSSSGKKKTVKSGMSIPSHALPVKLVRPEDLTKLSLMDEEEGQAPPLPSKVKVPPGTNI